MRMFRPEDRGVNLPVRLDANLAQRLDEALAKNEMKCTLTPISGIKIRLMTNRHHLRITALIGNCFLTWRGKGG